MSKCGVAGATVGSTSCSNSEVEMPAIDMEADESSSELDDDDDDDDDDDEEEDKEDIDCDETEDDGDDCIEDSAFSLFMLS